MEREWGREIYGREETRVSDSEGVRKEKEKGKEKEWEWESVLWDRDCFPKFFFGKQAIKNKPYFY